MKDETTKQTWETPEIIDLDLDETNTGKPFSVVESGSISGPGS